MRQLLRRLFRRPPRPIVIEFDRAAIVHARPGDVLVFTSPVRWSPELIESMQDRWLPELRKAAPGVAICINSPDWQTTLVATDTRPTREAQ